MIYFYIISNLFLVLYDCIVLLRFECLIVDLFFKWGIEKECFFGCI